MPKKEGTTPKRHHHHVTVEATPVTEPRLRKPRRSYFNFVSILPHLTIIAICIGIYYAMINYYLFFTWGFFIYYGLKFLIGYEILSASVRSIIVPLGSLLVGLVSLWMVNNVYFSSLISPDTAWQLTIIGLIGMLITVLIRI